MVYIHINCLSYAIISMKKNQHITAKDKVLLYCTGLKVKKLSVKIMRITVQKLGYINPSKLSLCGDKTPTKA